MLGSETKSKRTSKLIEKIGSILDKTLDYDYRISKYDDNIFTGKNIEAHLGQVKTPEWAAKLISDLCIEKPNLKILDPCFGNGVFLESANDRMTDLKHIDEPNLWGVEIDLIRFAEGLQNFSKNKKNFQQSFFCGNIFDFNEKSFDCILMNPPYTRQEKLSNENYSFMNKETLREKIKNLCGVNLSLRSNLYVYFVVYLSSLLKNNGRMGIIIPKGWMDSKHGIEFQEFLLRNFEIELIIDFAKDTFEDVIVEDCIVILKKNTNQTNKICFVHVHEKVDATILRKIIHEEKSFENKEMFVSFIEKNILFKDHKWGKFLQLNPNIIQLLQGKNLIPLSELAEIYRGVETNWNDFFILDDKKINQWGISDEFLTKIISSPKKLKKLDTKDNVTFDYLLTINSSLKSVDNHRGIRRYVDEHYEEVLKSDKNSILKKRAKQNIDSWYVTKPFTSSSIVFSYIIRKTKFFIKNSEKYLVRDNFYNIDSKENNSEILFSLLNSSLSRLQLELIGRRYGNGILKIQAYELREMMIPDITIMPEKVKKGLIEASRKLSGFLILDDKSSSVIDKIDRIVENFCKLKISSKEIKQIEKNMLESRMMRGH